MRSYLFMRLFVGALGLALPFMLVLIDGLAFDGDPFPRDSLSAYYYSSMREVFVGMLSAIAVFLLTYKIVEVSLDNTLSILAGFAALAIVLFPTGVPAHVDDLTPLQERLGESVVEGIHFIAASVFIVSLGVISFFFGVGERKLARREEKRSPVSWWGFHFLCSGVIGLAVLWIVLTELAGGPSESLLIGEVASVLAFGASWLMKGAELDTLLRGKPRRDSPAVGEPAARPSPGVESPAGGSPAP